MALDLKALAAEVAKMSPEERKALAQVFGGGSSSEEEEGAKKRKKNPPAAPKAERVYFFLQVGRIGIEEVERKGDELTKRGKELPDRVIMVDEKAAWRMHWKKRSQYRYLGRSEGKAWRKARIAGKTVGEAQALEYEAMKKDPDRTPPMSRERTFFAGTKAAAAAQGREISWTEGLQQNKTS